MIAQQSKLLITEWECDQCGKTAETRSDSDQPVPVPEGWARLPLVYPEDRSSGTVVCSQEHGYDLCDAMIREAFCHPVRV